MRAQLLAKRQRNSVLDALEIARHAVPTMSVTDLIAFFYVCENEGLNMRELSHLTRLSEPMISRTTRKMASVGSAISLPPAYGLLEVRVNASDRRGRTLHLTAAGETLRQQIEACIAQARHIRPELQGRASLGDLVSHDLCPGP